MWRICIPANVLRNITDPYTVSLSIYLLAVTRTVFTSWHFFKNTAENMAMEDIISDDTGWLNAQKRDYVIHISSTFNFFGSTHADSCTSCSGLHPLQQHTRIFFSLSSHEYLFSFHALIVAIHKSGADLGKFWFALLCESCVKQAFTTLLCVCHGNETLCPLEIGYSFIVLEVNCIL